jgi:hypothetical protein
MKPTTTLQQHYTLELILTMPQPFTAARMVRKAASEPAHEVVQVATMKMRLERLVELGWLTKGPTVPTPGRRGKPPTEYALVAGAARAWQQRERELQAAWREQSRRDDELLA